jgi:recombination protein U
MYTAKPRTNRSWQNMTNNARGHFFEGYIKGACGFYKDRGKAIVDQTPEPFRTTSTNRDGSFTGRFIANAQPDFKGTLAGGRAICFEAKYTSTDKMKRSAVTPDQMEALEAHYIMGAVSGVCIGIKDVFAFIPWIAWRDMKEIFGRQYMTVEDIEPYRIKFNGHALFLDFIHQQEEEEWILPEKTMKK